MDKLKMHTPNKADENFAKLAALFPNAVTEIINENGEVVRAIDKDILMQEISCTVVDGKQERYQFTWPDKRKSVLLANAPISKTLRPCREKSVEFDSTENLYIEGDNLEVLKLLQETYLGKIKMIYIDPPYNTGNDFVYEDDFAQTANDYLANSGQYDDEGNRLIANTENNGRFHTDWLNMIYPRLKLAKDLLCNDGFVFISIDDGEQDNIKKICSEIFGAENFVAQVVVQNDSRIRPYDSISITHEYILIYRKTEFANLNVLHDNNKKYPYYDEQGGFTLYELRNRNSDFNIDNRPNLYYPFWVNPKKVDKNGLFEIDLIEHEGWIKVYPQESKGIKTVWRWGKDTARQNMNINLFAKEAQNDYGYQIVKKYREDTYSISSVWTENKYSSDAGTLTFKKLFADKRVFTFPKPVDLIKTCLEVASNKDSIILDFFSGSATTAHAVMQLNAEDGGNRKFILVQLEESVEDKSEAAKAGYKSICEIGEDRIRRAGKKISDELGMLTQNIDIGFRVLKCDTSNMKEVYYKPDEVEQNMFDLLSDNIKEDRTPEDLLFQVMLDLGVLLSSKIEEITIGNCKVFNVAEGFLYACFDNNVSDEVVKEIATKKPYYAVFRDSGMANDSVMTNFDQIFASISPDTVRKVL